MAVKTADDAGTVTEKTIRTRTVSSIDDDSNKPWRNMPWQDFLAGLSAQAWTEYSVYLYRYDDKGNTWGVGKFANALDEFKIQEMFGGGYFNVKVKKGPQLIINEDVRIEGTPKTPEAAAVRSGAGGTDPLLMSIAALIEELRAARGGTVQTDAIRSAMSLQGQVFGAGVEAVKSTLAHVAPPATTAPDPFRDMQVQLMTAMIQKMLNPADPIVQFGAMVTAMKGLNLFGGTDGGKTTMAMELVRQLPTVTQHLVHGIEQWRMGEEARARSIAMTRGSAPPINVQPNSPAAPAAAPPASTPGPAMSPAEAAAAQPPIPEMQVQPMPLETLEQMICNIVADTNLTTEQAAEEACALIERSSPGQTDMMVQQGEEWMWNLFQNLRPILGQVKNHPRLRAFIQEFIKVVKAAPIIQPANPNAPPA